MLREDAMQTIHERSITYPTDAVAHRPETRSRTISPARWGRVAELTLISSLGVLMVSFAGVQSRQAADWAALPLWIGLLVIFVPIAIRMVSDRPSRTERISLLVVLWGMLYLVKVLHSPVRFTFGDELQHWRTAEDILLTGRLFAFNSILPVSPFYPGLEIVTSVIVHLTGLDIFSAGILVIGVARLVLVLTLFLLYERVGGSARLAGLATMLYIANPMFLFFDAQFAYESLALPFATFALFLLECREQAKSGRFWVLTLLAAAIILSVIVTHHVTTIMFLGFLMLWVVASFIVKGPRWGTTGRLMLTFLFALGVSIGWLLFVAHITIDYLGPTIASTLTQITQLITGETSGRQLYRSFGGTLPPFWEQATGYASMALVLLGLPFGIYRIMRHYRDKLFMVTLALGALIYPATNILRLTSIGVGIAVRLQEFLFLAVAFVLAMAFEGWMSRRINRWQVSLLTVCLALIYVGGIILGWSPSERLPGQYQASSHGRSVEPQSVAAAEWMRETQGSDNRLATDYFNRLMMGSFGQQYIPSYTFDGVSLWSVFYAPEIGPAEIRRMRRVELDFVVGDERLTRDLPVNGVYFEYGEPDARQHIIPLAPVSYTKFNVTDFVSRIFDSGDMLVFDIRGIVDAR
jgi:hypothetical protein